MGMEILIRYNLLTGHAEIIEPGQGRIVDGDLSIYKLCKILQDLSEGAKQDDDSGA